MATAGKKHGHRHERLGLADPREPLHLSTDVKTHEGAVADLLALHQVNVGVAQFLKELENAFVALALSANSDPCHQPRIYPTTRLPTLHRLNGTNTTGDQS